MGVPPLKRSREWGVPPCSESLGERGGRRDAAEIHQKGPGGPELGGSVMYGSTLRKRVFVLARESARVQHVAGTRKRAGKDKRT